jgi:hypothetical protein
MEQADDDSSSAQQRQYAPSRYERIAGLVRQNGWTIQHALRVDKQHFQPSGEYDPQQEPSPQPRFRPSPLVGHRQAEEYQPQIASIWDSNLQPIMQSPGSPGEPGDGTAC